MSLLLATSGDIASGGIASEGVDFAGVNDYLSRSSDLVGNVDSKTFTFSAWVYFDSNESRSSTLINSQNFWITQSFTTTEVYAKNSGGTTILALTLPNKIPSKTWTSVLLSIDLSNTANRSVYLNGVLASVTWTTYTNDIIDFTNVVHQLGSGIGGGNKLKGRLSNIFLDYVYRDLSIEANRRLFITADGKPTPTATLKALNPILYLPMKDSATAHINEGTGGNFTANGTFATSNRGANQDNCVASYFDGTADYLSKNLNTVANKTRTFSMVFKPNANVTRSVFTNYTGASFDQVQFKVDIGYYIKITAYNELRSEIFYMEVLNMSSILFYRNNQISVCVDLSNINKCKLFLNGVNIIPTTLRVANENFYSMSGHPVCIGLDNSTSYFNGNIGELYFDTKYIDLATNNPFWDAVENKPVPVRKVIANTGVTPLIAMPLNASNAGKNYGTGGDFTANSAPYVGARGASEFWARSVKKSTTYPAFSNSNYISASYTFSTVFCFRRNSDTDFEIGGCSGLRILVRGSVDGNVAQMHLGANTWVIQSAGNFTTSQWGLIFMSCNTQSNQYTMNVNGVGGTGYVSKSGTPYLSGAFVIGTDNQNQGEYANFYFTTDYIDFSQESNRLKFVDAMGYPTNLKEKIDAGIIPKPLIYLPFDDPTNLGKNLGTGGDFTVNGTVTQGADVNG